MTEGRPIRVMVVDDHRLVREGLALLVSTFDDMEVVADASDGAEALRRCAEHRPDVILMDIVMPGLDGPSATEQILAEHDGIRVLALTSFLDDELVRRAIQAGSSGYLLKSVGPEELAAAIRSAHRGSATLSAEAAAALLRSATEELGPKSDLTPRELDILRLIVEGRTNKEIASSLIVSPGTVRTHVSNILVKLGAQNRTEAATIAWQNGLVEREQP